MIIGCDGANSVVARASGLRTGHVQSDYAIDMMEETPREELSTAERDRMYIYYRIRSHYGYGYVFPKTAHLNVGVGFKLDYYLANLRGEHYAHHQSFVEDLKSKQVLAGQSNRANFKAFPLPISGPLARTYGDRVLLAGDAGGFVNALTAEGIYYAMVTGELAARAAMQGQLSGYERAWKREIGDELAHSVRLQKLLLADPTRIDRIVRAASRHPVLADLLAHYATGRINARCNSDDRCFGARFRCISAKKRGSLYLGECYEFSEYAMASGRRHIASGIALGFPAPIPRISGHRVQRFSSASRLRRRKPNSPSRA